MEVRQLNRDLKQGDIAARFVKLCQEIHVEVKAMYCIFLVFMLKMPQDANQMINHLIGSRDKWYRAWRLPQHAISLCLG